jgi:hypothetical protein
MEVTVLDRVSNADIETRIDEMVEGVRVKVEMRRKKRC